MRCINPRRRRSAPDGVAHARGASSAIDGDRPARRRSRLAAAGGVAIGLACVLASGCGSGSTSGTNSGSTSGGGPATSVNQPFQGGGAPQSGGVLRFARGVQPASFTPWIGEGNAELMPEMQVYDQLVEATPDPAVLAPGLADSWTISSNKLVYTFHIRQGVRFSNGTPLTADDLKFSLDNESNTKVDPNRATLLGVIRSVTIPDAQHLQVTLRKVTPAFLDYLTLANIVNKRAMQQLGAQQFGLHPVTTGPFMVTSFSPSNPTIQLKRNPYYWRPGLPHLSGITYKYIPDDNARMLAVESGSADVADGVPFSQLDRVNGSPGVKLFTQHAFASDWIVINGFKGPLSKAAVRRALVYATPLNEISRIVFHGVAPVSPTANMPTKYYDPSIKAYPYDAAKARQQLAQAGLRSLTLTLTIVSGDAVGKQVATILQSSWAKAGITLNIRQTDYSTALAALTHEDFQLLSLRPTDVTSDVPVDDEFDSFLTAPPTAGQFPWLGWNNPQARKLIQEATTTFDESVRKRDFSAYQRILAQDQPILSLVFVPNLFAVRTTVHNLVAVGTFWPLLGGTWLSR